MLTKVDWRSRVLKERKKICLQVQVSTPPPYQPTMDSLSAWPRVSRDQPTSLSKPVTCCLTGLAPYSLGGTARNVKVVLANQILRLS